MIGTFLNAAGIVAGGLFGRVKKKPLTVATQFFLKVGLGVATIFCGLRMTWESLNGTLLQQFRQLVIVLLALIAGKLAGRLLHLQKTSNRLGRFTSARMIAARPDNPQRFSDGFAACAVIFCAAPLGILGAIHDGLSGNYFPLAIKALMDGLAMMSFMAMFGWGVLFSAVPVLVFQGTITLVVERFLQPVLVAHGLVDSVNATGGLLIFCVALLIFEIKKVEVADYLPALVFAPLFTSFLH